MKRWPAEIVDKAWELRRQKLCYEEIGRKLGIPGTTVRNWCFDLGFDRHESLKINNAYRRNIIKESNNYLVPQIKDITPEQSRLFAALLYGCEGCKYPSTSRMAFVNSDPKLVKLFIGLLRKGFALEEDKFRILLQIHTVHDYKKVKEFWSKLLDIPELKFLKPTITVPRGKMRRLNYMGTCTLKYSDYKIQLKLQGIFDKFCNY